MLITPFCLNSDYSYHTVLPVVDIDHVAGYNAYLRCKGRMTEQQKEERKRREQKCIRERRTISQVLSFNFYTCLIYY